MLRPVGGSVAVWRVWAALAAAPALVGCGEQPPSDEEQVRETLTAFGRATAAKDYQALCDRLLAPDLIKEVKQIGLPCEIALQQGLGEVREPRLLIGSVTVRGKTANAEVRTTAAGQAPSRDTISLVKIDAGWRIASLATPSEPGPAP